MVTTQESQTELFAKRLRPPSEAKKKHPGGLRCRGLLRHKKIRKQPTRTETRNQGGPKRTRRGYDLENIWTRKNNHEHDDEERQKREGPEV